MTTQTTLTTPGATTRPGQQKTSDLMTRVEAAAYLGVSPATLATWATTRRYPLAMVRIGRVVKYRQRDLDAFIAARTTTNGEVTA